MLMVVGTRYLQTNVTPQRQGTKNPSRVPSAAFECGDGRYLQVVPNQRQWPHFCTLLGHPEWSDDPRFATPIARVEHQDLVYALVGEAMKARSASEWEELLLEGTIACSAINNFAEVFQLEQVKHRGLVQYSEMPNGDLLPGLALPFRYSETPSRIRSHPPRLGEHTVEVLREIGWSQDRIRSLLEEGVVRGMAPEEVAAR
jgi:crotonobetainyl-CoA:carnitine CoA-transferase CaiB-like acyl-CoA transferase